MDITELGSSLQYRPEPCQPMGTLNLIDKRALTLDVFGIHLYADIRDNACWLAQAKLPTPADCTCSRTSFVSLSISCST